MPTKTKKEKSNNNDNDNDDDKNKNSEEGQSIDMSEVDKTIAAILDEMAKASINVNENDGSGDENIDAENLFKGLFSSQQQDGGGGGEGGDGGFNFDNLDPDSVIDGMMEQLMSKELMYEPMKQVTMKFPQWLQTHQTVLSPEEYAK